MIGFCRAARSLFNLAFLVSMSDLLGLLRRLLVHPSLAHLSTSQLLAFFRLGSCLKNDILLAQSSHAPMTEAPVALPRSVIYFLADSMQINPEDIPLLWEETRFILWDLPSADQAALDDDDAFREHGLHRGLSEYASYI